MAEPLVRIEDYTSAPRIAIEWAPRIVFDPLAVREITEDLLVAGGNSLWLGEPGSGKTTALCDLLFRMPHATSWLGKRNERRATVLVAAESPPSARLRLEAFRRTHGEDVGAFGLIPCAVNLLDSLDVEALVDTVIRESNKLPLPVGLIAIDTVARVMPGANENASEDMGRLIAAGDLIRSETGAHVAFVHHLGKDAAKGARGHSSLRGAVDTEIEITFDKATGVRTLEVTKQRDLSSLGMTLSARFVSVDLGVNQWGRPITACVVEAVDPPSAHIQAVMRRVESERAEAVVLAAFRQLRGMGVAPTDVRNAQGYLPRQMIDKGMADGFDKQALGDAMNRLMSTGMLRRGIVGRYASNRAPKEGLLLGSDADVEA